MLVGVNCKYQKHVKQQKGQNQAPGKGSKGSQEEICKLKAGYVSGNLIDQDNLRNWKKPKNSNSKSHRFSANDASQIQLKNKFSILATEALEVGQQTPVLLKHKDRELKSFTVKTEKNKNKRTILLLVSSHGRRIGPMLYENLGTKFDSVIFSNQMLLLQRLLRIQGSLVKARSCYCSGRAKKQPGEKLSLFN
jgi:hypothetical protein